MLVVDMVDGRGVANGDILFKKVETFSMVD
jgi:hypothetical protein